MKKLFTLVLAAGMVASVAAQSKKDAVITTFRTAPSYALPVNADKNVDTLLFPSSFITPVAPGCTTITVIGDQDFGAVFGYNAFLDEEKGYQFNASGNVDSIGIGVAIKDTLFGEPTDLDLGNFRAKLYNFNIVDSSFTLVATSDPVNFADLDTNLTNNIPNLTFFKFTGSPAVTAPFVAMVEVFDIADTLSGFVMWSTSGTCGTDKAWEKYQSVNGETFAMVRETWSAISDPLMVVAMSNFASSNVSVTENTIQKSLAFPNPTADFIQIQYTLNAPSDVTLTVTDLTGKVVYTANEGSKFLGNNVSAINTSNFANGLYIYTLTAGKNVFNGKFAVSK